MRRRLRGRLERWQAGRPWRTHDWIVALRERGVQATRPKCDRLASRRGVIACVASSPLAIAIAPTSSPERSCAEMLATVKVVVRIGPGRRHLLFRRESVRGLGRAAASENSYPKLRIATRAGSSLAVSGAGSL